MEQHVIDRTVLVGLSADCFRPQENATEQTLEELRSAEHANSLEQIFLELTDAEEAAEA